MIRKKYLYIIFILLCVIISPLYAQDINISGRVEDSQGEPLMGVVVTTENGNKKAITDIDGHFSLTKSLSESSYVFSLLGYKNIKAKVQNNMKIVLNSDISKMNENIELGYTSMKKEDFSGAASTVYSMQMSKAPVPVLMQTFAGNLSGLTAHETYSEVGRETYNLYVRGISNIHGNQPLVIIDGVICYPGTSQYNLSYISADEIESVTVLKDAASQALYGTEGEDGIIVITTKHGIPGKLKVNFSMDESLQQVTTTPTFINSAEYATLRNEAAYNDGLGKNYFFSDNDIQKYSSGTDPYLYPNTNWRKMMMKDFVQMQRIGVNLSGGTNNVTYFSNFNVMHDDGPYKTESNNKYNPNNSFYWFNFRSNLEVKITNFLSASLGLAGNIKKEHTPGGGYLSSIYPHLFTMPSTTYGPITPTIENSDYPAGSVIVTEKEDTSPYGQVNRTGYINNTVTNVYANFGLKLDMDFLAKGLSLAGNVAYMSNTTNGLSTTKTYRRYERDTTVADSLTFVRKGTTDNTNLSYSHSSAEFYDMFYKGTLNYVFNLSSHHLNATAYSFYQHYESKDTSSPALLPYDHITSGLDIAYNYAHRYALRFDLGYSGCEEYARSHRWTATPAASAAWMISNESFMKNVAPILNLAKVRVSYGLTACDQTDLSRYAYEDYATVSTGGTISYLQYETTEGAFGNSNIHAETMKKVNLGLDLGLYNLVNVSVDVFNEKSNNMVCQSVSLIPSYQGIPLGNYPMTNSGSFQNKGYEVELSIGKAFHNGLEFNVGGFLAYNKNKIKNIGEVSLGSGYVYPYQKQGFSVGQTFGYLIDRSNGNGFYNFQGEIDNGPTYSFGTPRVGDLKYKDLNNDGVIDDKDKVPITHGSIPNYTYGINGYLKYKSFDISVLFDGVGRWNSFYSGMGVWENSYDGAFGSLHKNAWTSDRWNNGEKITYPALSTTISVNHQTSEFFVYDRSYIRLKNLEFGYTLPAKLTKHFNIEKLRFVLSGQNLFTWDHMKSNDFGPEADSYQSVPVYRVYNIGLRATF